MLPLIHKLTNNDRQQPKKNNISFSLSMLRDWHIKCDIVNIKKKMWYDCQSDNSNHVFESFSVTLTYIRLRKGIKYHVHVWVHTKLRKCGFIANETTLPKKGKQLNDVKVKY